MCEFVAHGTYIAKRGKGGANVGAGQGGVVLDASQPITRPIEGLDQLTRQAKRQVKATDPRRARCGQPISPCRQGVKNALTGSA